MTHIQIYIGIAVFLWIYGYLIVDFEKPTGSVTNRAFVRPPVLLYVLCGLPRSKKNPRGVMAFNALFMQLQAFSCLILAFLSRVAPEREVLWMGMLLIGGTMLNFFLAMRLHHLYPYKRE